MNQRGIWELMAMNLNQVYRRSFWVWGAGGTGFRKEGIKEVGGETLVR